MGSQIPPNVLWVPALPVQLLTTDRARHQGHLNTALQETTPGPLKCVSVISRRRRMSLIQPTYLISLLKTYELLHAVGILKALVT